MTMHDFIKQRPHLVWWVTDYDKLDTPAIVEATLNYGDWEDVQNLIHILGIQQTAQIFRTKSQLSKMGRQNYGVKTKQYFTRYFDRYA